MATIKDGKGTLCLAAFDKNAKLERHELGRPECADHDVKVEIKYCGMCHSDLHAVNGDWGINSYPLTPGHEIAGIVMDVGKSVTDFKKGDRVGVGCFVESCGSCGLCKNGEENYCRNHKQTYGNEYPKGKGHDDCAGNLTNGGYSTAITVRDHFVYKVPEGLDLELVGPLLCAGITMFSPLNKYVLSQGGSKKVGIVGFGGLGQMGIQLAKAMNCEVTVLSRSTSKKSEAEKLGANILAHTDEDAMKKAAQTLDVIIDTVAFHHDIAPLMSLLNVGGTYVSIGAFPKPFTMTPMNMIFNKYNYTGSLVGGVPETQQMLEFCAKHKCFPEIEVIHAKDATAQFKALADGTAGTKRAVIDMSTLKDLPEKDQQSSQ
jgi:uncharacterized zinc-type alcohol dehydrogenase-like protein